MLVRRSAPGVALAVAAALALVLGGFAALSGGGGAPAATAPSGGSATGPTAPSLVTSTRSPAASNVPSVSISPAATSAATSAAPTPPAVALPGLIGAIGDSLTVAVNASGVFGDQPEHSWVLGDDPDDPVVSHLERLRELGGDPEPVMAARPGAAVGSATVQATTIVSAAAGLPAGAGAYVTFELGANDICAGSLDDATAVDAFAAAVQASLGTLQAGLPPGSLLVVLSVPDVTRLRTVLEDVPTAQALHQRYDVCRGVLGESVAVEPVLDRIRAYNAALVSACEAMVGASLSCRHDLAGEPSGSLFGAEFDLADLSPLDWFHPSLEGQARIAEEAWTLTPWAEDG